LSTEIQDNKSVLVIGAGIAGATAAQRLSQADRQVHLIDKADSIGGHAAEMGCKATDTCLRCNVCAAEQLLRNVSTWPDVHIHTRTELVSLEAGTNGSRYSVILKSEPTFINRSKCIGCQACVGVCPAKCITNLKIAAVPVIDYSSCRLADGKECSACEQVCPADAIDMQDKHRQSKIDVDSVVVAAGYEPYNPVINASYGYGTTDNIITGIEAERQLAAASKITRPSDGAAVKRLAFIQCVGSRSEEVHRRPEDTDYCSAVCCAYALRMAQLMKHHSTDAEVTIFYMDIQNFGKGFNDFYNKCKDSMTFIRSRPYEVKPGPNGMVRVKFAPQGGDSAVCEEEFDLVVLAVGIRPNPDAAKLAEKLLVPVDEQGFFGLKSAGALASLQREGIFAVGACEGPKDIEACMRQAEAVSAAIISDN